jgi:pimeloyl-ACP methyl ester carboxylesterase
MKAQSFDSPLLTTSEWSHASKRRTNWPAKFGVLVVCVLVWTFGSCIYPPSNNNKNNIPGETYGEEDAKDGNDLFQWKEIVPSTSLEYKPCFSSSFLCARLSVPLNWNSTEDDDSRAAVAVIKLPAKVPVTDPRYGGAIIVNPGGPGESGVYQVLSDGESLQALVDSPMLPTSNSSAAAQGKYFDILSIDPRGVNNTTPHLRCFPDAFHQQVWQLLSPDYGLLWHSESIIGMEWGRAAALGASCEYGKDEDGLQIVPYLNTAQTVQDMAQLIEKEGEWRQQEARRILSAGPRTSKKDEEEIMSRVQYRPGQEKIQYWGMSYGTILGATFAAMHPDRVGRLILDGVVDPADHYAGRWLTQLQDSDKIVSQFCAYCFEAGPTKCPFYTGSSPADVEARFTSILFHLKENPIAVVPLDDTTGPEMVTYNDVHLRLLSGLYFPFTMAENFFTLLLALESRNSSSRDLATVVTGKQALLTPLGCQQEGSESPILDIPYVSGVGAFQSISCMDIGGSLNLTRPEFRAYLDELLGQSRWIGPSWARNKLACEGFTARPAWKPALSFEMQEWANTSHGLLIIGNTHDTVTPLRNARRVSTLFPGSVVLHQDSEGHCSHSSPSICTAKRIRQYFHSGELPDEGTVCEPEVRPFLGCVSGDGGGGNKCNYADTWDAQLWKALVELADPFRLQIDAARVTSWLPAGYPTRN